MEATYTKQQIEQLDADFELVATGNHGYQAWHVDGRAYQETPEGEFLRMAGTDDDTVFQCEDGTALFVDPARKRWVEEDGPHDHRPSGHFYLLQTGDHEPRLIGATRAEWAHGGPWDPDRERFLSEGECFQRLRNGADYQQFLGWEEDE